MTTVSPDVLIRDPTKSLSRIMPASGTRDNGVSAWISSISTIEAALFAARKRAVISVAHTRRYG